MAEQPWGQTLDSSYRSANLPQNATGGNPRGHQYSCQPDSHSPWERFTSLLKPLHNPSSRCFLSHTHTGHKFGQREQRLQEIKCRSCEYQKHVSTAKTNPPSEMASVDTAHFPSVFQQHYTETRDNFYWESYIPFVPQETTLTSPNMETSAGVGFPAASHFCTTKFTADSWESCLWKRP